LESDTASAVPEQIGTERAPLHERTRAWLRAVPWNWLLVLGLAWITWPIFDLTPGTGFDQSWRAALHLAARQGLDWGSVPLTFPYGPLAFLAFPALYFGPTLVASIVVVGLTQIALCYTLLRSLRRVFVLPIAVVLAWIVLRLPHFAVDSFVFLVFMWCALALDEPSLRTRRWLAPAAGVACAFDLLVKPGPAIGIAVVAAITVWVVAPYRWRAELLFLGSLALSTVVLWLVALNPLGNLWTWLHETGRLVVSFSSAQALEEPGREWEYFAAAILLVLLAELIWRQARGNGQWRSVVITAIFAFTYFKEGFVRHDSHSQLFFGACAFAYAAYAWRGRLKLVAVGALLLTALCAGAAVSPGATWSFVNPVRFGTSGYDSARAAVLEARTTLDSQRRHVEREQARQAVRDKLNVDPVALQQLAGHTVNVDPWEISAIWAYGLDWRPIPSLQTTLAWTQSLDAANAGLLASPRAPERILRQYEPVRLDDTTPQLDSPGYFFSLLCNYAEEHATADWQVVGKVPNRCSAPEAISSIHAHGGDTVTVPAARSDDELVYARFHADRPLIDPRALLLKPSRNPELELNGNHIQYRVNLATAQNPVVLRGPGNLGFRTRYGPLDASTIKLTGVPGYRVDFYRVRMRPTYSLAADGKRIETPFGPIVNLPGALQGHLDSATVVGDKVYLGGWAADPALHGPVNKLLVFADGRLVSEGEAFVDRPDVAAFLHDPRLQKGTGFSFALPVKDALPAGPKTHLRIFAVRDNVATELAYPGAYPWR
jgi:hypothetical protein